jgi:hypothetical protein
MGINWLDPFAGLKTRPVVGTARYFANVALALTHLHRYQIATCQQ